MSKNGTSFSDATIPMSSFMEAMASAQKRWMQTLATSDESSSAFPPLFNEAASQWQSAMDNTMDTWSGETEPIVKQTMERMTQSQSLMLQISQMAMEAWQEAAQRVQEGDDVQHVMQAYVERVDEQIRKATTSLNHLAQDQQASWQTFVETMQGAGLPFGMLLSMMPTPSDRGRAAETPVAAMFESLYRLFEFETLGGRLLDAPAIGLSREFNEKVAQAFKSFQEYQRASVRYQTVVSSIWSDTLQNFATKLGERMQEGEGLDTMRDLSTLWTKVADKTFVRAFRTEDYIEAQNDYLEASLSLRQHQRILSEEFQRALDQPTRSELDEVYKLLNRLRRENKSLKNDLKNVAPADGHAAAPSPTASSGEDAAALRSEVDALRSELADLKADVHAASTAAPDPAAEARPAQDDSPADEAAPNGQPAGDAFDDLTAIKGIGSATQDQFYEAGLTTYQQLADASGDEICEALGADINADRLSSWRSAADELAS